jgi:hypothetical protein
VGFGFLTAFFFDVGAFFLFFFLAAICAV